MAKVIIREIIISLLVCLAVLLLLSVLFYNLIPNNKVIPEKITYQASEDVRNEVNTQMDENTDLIIKTYEVTANEIDTYERTEQYKPGKANPFAPISILDEETSDESNSSSGDITGESIDGTTGNNQTGGSLFENGSSK